MCQVPRALLRQGVARPGKGLSGSVDCRALKLLVSSSVMSMLRGSGVIVHSGSPAGRNEEDVLQQVTPVVGALQSTLRVTVCEAGWTWTCERPMPLVQAQVGQLTLTSSLTIWTKVSLFAHLKDKDIFLDFYKAVQTGSSLLPVV